MAKNTKELLALLTDSPMHAVDERGSFHYSPFEDLGADRAQAVSGALTNNLVAIINQGDIDTSINVFTRNLLDGVDLYTEEEVLYAMFIVGRMYADVLSLSQNQIIVVQVPKSPLDKRPGEEN